MLQGIWGSWRGLWAFPGTLGTQNYGYGSCGIAASTGTQVESRIPDVEDARCGIPDGPTVKNLPPDPYLEDPRCGIPDGPTVKNLPLPPFVRTAAGGPMVSAPAMDAIR